MILSNPLGSLVCLMGRKKCIYKKGTGKCKRTEVNVYGDVCLNLIKSKLPNGLYSALRALD